MKSTGHNLRQFDKQYLFSLDQEALQGSDDRHQNC